MQQKPAETTAGTTAASNSLVIGEEYDRRAVARAFADPFTSSNWRNGVKVLEGNIILFITLDKSRHPSDHKYEDAFENARILRWQSQNRDTHSRWYGPRYVHHAAKGDLVHIFVRATQLRDGKARPFRYLGFADYDGSEGDAPMTVWWRLRTAVPPELSTELRVPVREAARVAEGPPADYSAPDRWAQTRVRPGQRLFRDIVLERDGGACRVCGLAVLELLDAAHLIPWSDSETDRLNPSNGLTLCVLHHRAHDAGLFHIAKDETVVVSPTVLRRSDPESYAAIRIWHRRPLRTVRSTSVAWNRTGEHG